MENKTCSEPATSFCWVLWGLIYRLVDTYSKAFKDEGLAMFGIGGCSKQILIFVGEYGLCHVKQTAVLLVDLGMGRYSKTTI